LYHPAVCILSLAAPAVIRFWRRRPPGEGAPALARNSSACGCTRTHPHTHFPPAFLPAEEGGGQAPPLASVVLPPRSLLVFQDEAYTGCLHGIEAVETEAIDGSVANAQQCGLVPGDALPRGGERVSLTVRRVLKVHKGLAIRL
jgi:alkylated DNA repair protein alkB family protein 6